MANTALAEHLRSLVDRHLARLEESLRFEQAKDPVEALHDLRVASRRLRAFGDVFRPVVGGEAHAQADKALRKVTRAARELRDWDVHVALLESRLPRAATDAERAALEHVLEDFARQRAEVARRTKKKLHRVDFDGLRVLLRALRGATLERLPAEGAPTIALARELIEPVLGEAIGGAVPDDGIEHPEELHRLRLSLKRLRYALELFAPLYGGTYEVPHERARALQDLLGEHHDLVVVAELLARGQADLLSRRRATLAAGIASFHAQIEVERRELFERYLAEPSEPGWWRERVLGPLQ
jgi:CHAD domain-containing protein